MCDLYVPDIGSNDSEYGSYFFTSKDMPSVEGLVPPDHDRAAVRNAYFFREDSRSEARILVYHDFLRDL